MKQWGQRICLGIACLLLGMGMPVTAAEPDLSGLKKIIMPSGDMAERTPSKPLEMLSPSDAQLLNEQMAGYMQKGESLLKNQAAEYYYYNNLDPVAKELYDVMLQVARDPVSEGNIGFIMTDIDPRSEEYYYEFNLAYRAVCFDHPELFWLYSGEEAEMCYYSEALMQNGFYFVYVKMVEPFTRFEEQMTAFNRAAEAFLADIDTSGSEYQTIRQIHDKLIGLVNYNDPVADHRVWLSRGQDLAHTAYGVLVEDSSGIANYAVCDGYSLAFEYLLQQCGIEAVFIGGVGGNSEEEMGGHAWNMVKMDGSWYEVDATWNDRESMVDDLNPMEPVYEYVLEALNDTAYRERVEHFLFLVSTETMHHFIPGGEYTYFSQDGRLELPLVWECFHARLQDDGAREDPDKEVISLAPLAMQNYQ